DVLHRQGHENPGSNGCSDCARLRPDICAGGFRRRDRSHRSQEFEDYPNVVSQLRHFSMNSAFPFLRTTLVGGLLVLLPLGLIAFVVAKAVGIIKALTAPVVRG